MNTVFVGITLGLMLLSVYIWLAVLRSRSSLLLNFFYVFVTIFMFWSYVRAMNSRPVNKSLNASTSHEFARYCERCDADKAAFVHHCSVCNRCVYRMDHHCPWIGNCVAWSNKKFFLLFLVYTALNCWVFNVMATSLMWSTNITQHKLLLQCGWTLTLSIGSLLTGYFVFHLWLLREGKTTLEFLSGKQGELINCSFTHNVTVYFGQSVWSWWVPTTPLLDMDLGGHGLDDEMEPV